MQLFLFVFALIAGASAFEAPISRRNVMARFAAAAPLAALAQQAKAERQSNAALTSDWMGSAASNSVLGVAKAAKPGYEATEVTKGMHTAALEYVLAATMPPLRLPAHALTRSRYPLIPACAAIGRNSVIDPEWAAALPPSAKYDTKTYAFSTPNIGEPKKNTAAMERLMAR